MHACTHVVQVGLAGLIVAWLVTPVCVVLIFVGGTRYIAPSSSRTLVALLAAGISVCGGSAITAVAAAIRAPQEEQALAISIVSFFTIICMLALPYIALAVGMDVSVAAAWIGGTVNNTGNVVASVEILDTSTLLPDGSNGCLPGQCAGEMGAIVKMAQNALLGVLSLAASVYWITYEEDAKGGAGGQQEKDAEQGQDIEMAGVSATGAQPLAHFDACRALSGATWACCALCTRILPTHSVLAALLPNKRAIPQARTHSACALTHT
jgi:uncharacterized membrane protein YadS